MCPESVNEYRDRHWTHSLYVVRVPMVFPYPLTNHIAIRAIRARMPSEVEAEF